MAKAPRLPANYERNVFINCPFDGEYQPLFYGIEKIQDLIAECKYSIHDISRVDLDPVNSLPRFNMPLELGLDLGCRQYGKPYHQENVVLVLDTEQYRYQKYISDLAGRDPVAHNDSDEQVINEVRNWLRLELDPKLVKTPSGSMIYQRYEQFQLALPSICAKLHWDINNLPFSDFAWAVADWIVNNPIS
jgi:hypothetical protein